MIIAESRVNVAQNISNLYDICCVLQFQMLFKAIFGGWLVNIPSVNPDEDIFDELGIDDENIFR